MVRNLDWNKTTCVIHIADRVVNGPPTLIHNKLFIYFTYICLNVRLIFIFSNFLAARNDI